MRNRPCMKEVESKQHKPRPSATCSLFCVGDGPTREVAAPPMANSGPDSEPRPPRQPAIFAAPSPRGARRQRSWRSGKWCRQSRRSWRSPTRRATCGRSPSSTPGGTKRRLPRELLPPGTHVYLHLYGQHGQPHPLQQIWEVNGGRCLNRHDFAAAIRFLAWVGRAEGRACEWYLRSAVSVWLFFQNTTSRKTRGLTLRMSSALKTSHTPSVASTSITSLRGSKSSSKIAGSKVTPTLWAIWRHEGRPKQWRAVAAEAGCRGIAPGRTRTLFSTPSCTCWRRLLRRGKAKGSGLYE